MTTYLGKSCSFGLPHVPFVNCCQFMYLVISLLVLRAGYGIWLCQFLIIAYPFTLRNQLMLCLSIPIPGANLGSLSHEGVSVMFGTGTRFIWNMSANDSEIVKAPMIGSFLANFLIILILDELSSFGYQPDNRANGRTQRFRKTI